jgi:phage baseplate assembly protein V
MLDRSDLRQLQLWLRPLRQRVANIVARGVVQLVADAKKLQHLQLGVLAGETIDDAEHHQPYGFSSVPLAGAEAVALFPNGDRERPLVVSVSDRRHRPKDGEPGQVDLYHYTGARVTMLANGNIEVCPGPGGEVKIGAASAGEPPALASELTALKDAIATWTPVANDGGASLKQVFDGWAVVGATKVKVE